MGLPSGSLCPRNAESCKPWLELSSLHDSMRLQGHAMLISLLASREAFMSSMVRLPCPG